MGLFVLFVENGLNKRDTSNTLSDSYFVFFQIWWFLVSLHFIAVLEILGRNRFLWQWRDKLNKYGHPLLGCTIKLHYKLVFRKVWMFIWGITWFLILVLHISVTLLLPNWLSLEIRKRDFDSAEESSLIVMRVLIYIYIRGRWKLK